MKTNQIKDKSQIDDLIKSCVEKLKSFDLINTIILFGSYARGDFSLRHSDIDLYILIDNQRDFKFERKLYREVNQLSKEVQIHLNFEYKNLLKEGNLLRYNILKEGIILYEKTKTVFLKNDFDLNETYLIQLDLSKLKPNQKSNFKRSMLTKYKSNVINYSGNIIIIYKSFFNQFEEISNSKNISFQILEEFLYKKQNNL